MTQAPVEETETEVFESKVIQDVGGIEEEKKDPTFFPESIVATAVA